LHRAGAARSARRTAQPTFEKAGVLLIAEARRTVAATLGLQEKLIIGRSANGAGMSILINFYESVNYRTLLDRSLDYCARVTSTGRSQVQPWRSEMPAIDVYRACGEVGHVGTPGAPIMTYSLLVVAGSGLASGHVTLKQAVNPPLDVTFQVTGNVHALGPNHRVVTLTGTYTYNLPPPIILSILEHFNATLLVDAHWDGHGTFTYGAPGEHTVSGPVKSHPCP
jgi:Domain of unknown function (DUF1842)